MKKILSQIFDSLPLILDFSIPGGPLAQPVNGPTDYLWILIIIKTPAWPDLVHAG